MGQEPEYKFFQKKKKNTNIQQVYEKILNVRIIEM